MAINITFLGTASMVPTKKRNVQSTHIEYNGDVTLVDCGEGTQRQMNIAGLNRLKIKRVLISHWHGDHVSGLIGLIQTMGEIDKPFTLEVYGPIGTKEKMQHLLNSCYFNQRINIKIHEINPEKLETFFENDDFMLQAIKLKHSIPCLGYNFIEKDKIKIDTKKLKAKGLKEGKWLQKIQKGESVKVKDKTIKPEDISFIVKGKKVSIIMDTAFNPNLILLSKDADLLISESVFAADLQELATKYKHMTSKDAATIAKQANVKKLVLTHFSQRYKTIKPVLDDARAVFKNVVAAQDFMQIKV